MDEKSLISLTSGEISAWNFDRLHDELAKELAVYDSIVYSDESIKSAKDNKKQLGEWKKHLEDARKAFKSQCLAPYEAVEVRVKELVSMIDTSRSHIDETVDAYNESVKRKKKDDIFAFYCKKCQPLGELAPRLFETVFCEKWLNVSCRRPQYEEEVITAVSRAAEDIKEIKAMNSPFEQKLIEVYISSHSLDDVKAKNDEYSGVFEETQANAEPLPIQKEMPEEHGEYTLLRIKADKSKLETLFDFMRAIGIEYELV